MIHIDSIREALGPAWHLVEFFVSTIVLKYIVAHWIAERLVSLFKHFFVRSKREMAIWLHYRNQALNKGHRHDTPIDCDDDACKMI